MPGLSHAQPCCFFIQPLDFLFLPYPCLPGCLASSMLKTCFCFSSFRGGPCVTPSHGRLLSFFGPVQRVFVCLLLCLFIGTFCLGMSQVSVWAMVVRLVSCSQILLTQHAHLLFPVWRARGALGWAVCTLSSFYGWGNQQQWGRSCWEGWSHAGVQGCPGRRCPSFLPLQEFQSAWRSLPGTAVPLPPTKRKAGNLF